MVVLDISDLVSQDNMQVGLVMVAVLVKAEDTLDLVSLGNKLEVLVRELLVVALELELMEVVLGTWDLLILDNTLEEVAELQGDTELVMVQSVLAEGISGHLNLK